MIMVRDLNRGMVFQEYLNKFGASIPRCKTYDWISLLILNIDLCTSLNQVFECSRIHITSKPSYRPMERCSATLVSQIGASRDERANDLP